MDIRSIIRNTGIYALGDFFNKAISFLLLPLFTAKLVPSDYGIIDTFTILQLILGILINWEINQALVRFVPEQDDDRKTHFFSSAFCFILVNQLVFVGILLVFHHFFAGYVQEDPDKTIYFLGVLYVFFNLLNSFFLIAARIQIKPSLVFWASMGNGIVTTTLGAWMVLYLDKGLTGYFVAMLSGSLVSLVILVGGLYKIFSWGSVQKKLVNEMLRFSIPLIPSALGVFLTMYIDRVVIKEHFSDADLGIFGIAYRFAVILTIFLGAYLSSIGPVIFRDYKNPDFTTQLNQYLRFFLFICLLLLTGFGLFTKEGILLFTSGGDYLESTKYVFLLALNAAIYSFYVFFPSLAIVKKTGIISLINIGGALVNVVGIVLLIPYLDIYGILVSTLVSSLIIQLLTYQLGKKHYSIKIDVLPVLLFAGCVLMIGLVHFFDLYQYGFTTNLEIILVKSGIFIAAVLLFYLALLKPKQKS